MLRLHTREIYYTVMNYDALGQTQTQNADST